MSGQVDVVNTALGALGKEPVVDLSAASLAQSVAAAKLMRSIEAARATVLVRHGWLCALEYVTLQPAALPGYPPNWRYPLVFLAPGGALRMWEIAGDILDGRELGWPEPRWELGTFETGAAARIIVRVRRGWEASCTDGGGLNVSYVRLANWAALSPHLADAIAYDTAARQCVSITGDKALAGQLAGLAESKVMKAIGEDGTQTGGQPPLAPSIPASIRAYAGNNSGWFPSIWDRV